MLRKIMLRKFALFTIAVLCAVILGGLLPTLTYAAGPQPQAAPVDAAGALYALIGLVLTAVTGGAVAFILDDFKPWKDWGNANAKTTIVLLLNAAIGAGLLALQPYIPSALESLPQPVVVFLGFFASYLVNQLTHQTDAKFNAWRTQEKNEQKAWASVGGSTTRG